MRSLVLLLSFFPAMLSSQSILFRSAPVFDGERVHAGTDVLVENGRIVRMGKALVAPLGDGRISDFEGERPTALFGTGWVISTDAMAGGKSVATMTQISSGASGTSRALEVKGTVAPGAPAPWAGVMFSPGERSMAPANLSSKKEVVFWVRGDGRSYQIMLFSRRLGYTPTSQPFTTSAEWKEVVLPFSRFDLDGSDIMGMVFAATGEPGDFSFAIDEVRVR